jgi:WD40 repeat protein
MNDEGPQTVEEQFASLAAACDEALAAGSAPVEINPEVPPELRPRLERGVACMKLLRQALPQVQPTPATLAREPAASAALTRLGRFELRRELGHGAFGIVWLAHDPQLRRDVALKVPRAEALVSPEARARFLREARAAAGLDHPNVVPVYEAGEADSVCYIASGYCPGTTLAAWLKQRDEPVPAREAAALVATLAEAVEHAHGRGVVHRDLKPSNVLLEMSREGEAPAEPGLEGSAGASPSLGTPKITDFGLAKLQAEGEGLQTESGAIVGTPCYMAPEQAGGHTREVGPAADVYALGAILYEVLTGRPPFQGEMVLDVLLQVRTQEPVPPGQLRARLPRDLETICLKCLEKAPAKRYATAQALADDLRRLLADEPVQARPVGRAERLWRWCRRHPARAVAILLAAVVVVGLPTSFAISEALNARRLAEEKENTTKEHTKTLGALAASEGESAHLALDRGLNLCEQGEVGRGLLFLTRSLEHAVQAEDPELERAVRLTLAGWSREVNPLVRVLPHQTSADGVVCSPDGRTIMTLDGNTVRLWNAATGQPLGTPLEHKGPVDAVAFSPDSKIVLTGSGIPSWSTRLWDAATGKPLGPPLPHKGPVSEVAFSPDGRSFCTGGYNVPGQRWQTDGGRPLGPSNLPGLVFSRDGRRVAGEGPKPGTVQVWDAGAGKELALLDKHSDGLWAIAFSPDGQTLLTHTPSGLVRLWKAATGEPMGPEMSHPKVSTAALSPDGKLVLTGGWDNTARLWDVATGRLLGQPLQHQAWVKRVAFSPGGETALTWGDGGIRLWGVRPDGLVELPRGPAAGSDAPLSPDGKLVLAVSYQTGPRLWEVTTGQPIGHPLLHPHALNIRSGGLPTARLLSFSPDGKTILMSCRDKAVRIWEIASGQGIGSPLQHQDSVVRVAFSPSGKLLLTAGGTYPLRRWAIPRPAGGGPTSFPRGGLGEDRPVGSDAPGPAVRLWETATGRPFGRPFEHVDRKMGVSHGIAFAVFSPDGKTILTGGGRADGKTILRGGDTTARLWDVATSNPIGGPLQHLGAVRVGAFSSDGKTILTGSSLEPEEECRRWDAATGKPLGPPLRLGGPFAFSPDGKLIVVTGNTAARLWDTATGQPFGPLLQHGGVRAVAFSPDGKTVLTGGQDGSARLWDVATGQPLGAPLKRLDNVGAVAFSPNGKSVLTGSDDYTARLWEVAAGRPLGPPLRHQAIVRGLAFSPDGQVLLTGSGDGTGRLWAAATGQPLGPPLRHQAGVVSSVAFSPDGKTVVTGGDDKTARLWSVPGPVSGAPERITVWAQVLTGLELDKYGEITVLDADTWQQRRQRLAELGGPPRP